jgi:hypothetical protein
MIATVEPAADSYVEAQVLRARCLLSAAQFRAAAAAANDAARFSQERDGAMVLRLIAACAEMIARPSVEHRGVVRELAVAIPATACPLWRAYARMIDARRIAVEVTLQARSLHGLGEVRKFLRGAAELFNEAERPEEARDELAMLVEIIEKGPPTASGGGGAALGRSEGKSACRRRRHRRGAGLAGHREHRFRGSATHRRHHGYSWGTSSTRAEIYCSVLYAILTCPLVTAGQPFGVRPS